MDILKRIHWIHHASFRIEAGDKIIYIDPWKLKNPVKADYIFITHGHFDHFSMNDIEVIADKNTVITGPEEIAKEIQGFKFKKMKPGDEYKDDFLKASTIPAYNIGKNFHSPGSGKLGYIIEVEGARILHAGDTDFIPEHKKLKDITVAIVPVSGTYTMNFSEAAEMVNTVKPEAAIPMHYNEIVGTLKDAEDFKKAAKVKVEILKAGD